MKAALLCILACAGLLCWVWSQAIGMKLLTMEIYRNDQLVLRGNFDAPDRKGLDYFWERAGRTPFGSEEVVPVKADPANPLHATLEGVVNRLMTQATLTNLNLVRGSSGSVDWCLSGQDVQRAKKAAGLWGTPWSAAGRRQVRAGSSKPLRRASFDFAMPLKGCGLRFGIAWRRSAWT